MTERSRETVIVRARQIAEDRAALAAMAAVATSNAARVAAQIAHRRAGQHPLGPARADIPAAELLAASGSAAALREAAATADRRAALANLAATEARQAADAARAQRKAAERFAERRRQAAAVEAARRTQRMLDETAALGGTG